MITRQTLAGYATFGYVPQARKFRREYLKRCWLWMASEIARNEVERSALAVVGAKRFARADLRVPPLEALAGERDVHVPYRACNVFNPRHTLRV